jgi:hypothetical protein
MGAHTEDVSETNQPNLPYAPHLVSGIYGLWLCHGRREYCHAERDSAVTAHHSVFPFPRDMPIACFPSVTFTMEEEIDGWIEQLSACKQLPEVDVKKLCDKVR